MPTPRSTYRVQISPDFDLDATAALTDYLADLGVTHLYASPLLSATPGSAHGYDVVDHASVDEARGGEPARARLVAALRARGLGLLLDIVPNHMGVSDAAANRAWWDVLHLGAQAAYAHWFDIDWTRGRLVLPVLGDGPDELDRLRVEDGELRYYEHRFPLAVSTADAGSPREIHDRQHYRLVSWRRGDAEINYRRFFAVATLAGIRVEESDVFEAAHALPLRWAAAGEIDGLRIDHPDGLADPSGYLERLAEAAPPGTWLLVEKILQPGEQLPDWPVAGTTGYDALAEVDRVLADRAAEPRLKAAAGTPDSWEDLVHDCKLDVATGMMQAELDRLVALAPSLDGWSLDVARAAMAELLACFPAYRSYLPAAGTELVSAAATRATAHRPDLAGAVEAIAARLGDARSAFTRRFQQQTGAVMAKGAEDTAYYRYTHYLPATEVGADPTTIGWEPADFHAAMARRLDRAPRGMTTLSTHDAKRSEDVRARLATLTEIPGEWADHLKRWEAAAPLPDRSVSALLWQTVVGSWPIARERLHAALEKSAREARTATSWDAPSREFETAMHAAIDRVFDDPELRADVESFADAITPAGWSNSLSAKLVQLTMPGVPDVYQGTELWDNGLVDPDNRRPVDFGLRRRLLAEIDGGRRPPVDATGAARLLVVATALRLRRDRPDAFTAYRPLEVPGPASRHVVAFDRGGSITVATRLPLTLADCGGFGETSVALPAGRWVDRLTGVEHGDGALRELTAHYPVALLTRD